MKKITLHYFIVFALFIYSNCNAQTSNFIVTTSQDTIYVDEINLTDFQVKTKIGDKKKKYKIDEISSYYLSKKNEHYERVIFTKSVVKKPDRYDYRRNEDFYIEDYDNRIKYNFFQRLTDGKVKLFTEGSANTVLNSSPKSPGYMTNTFTSDDIKYYIGIDNSKLELLNEDNNLKLPDFDLTNYDGKLKLTKKVYEILKIYLYSNIEIEKKLNNLFLSKPKAKEKQIIDLINEYNIWVKSN